MNDTLKAILQILDAGTPELKVASAQILGELQPKEAVVIKALETQLNYGESVLNRYVLEALSRIGSPEAVAVLVSHLADGGRTGELVGHLLSHAGAAIVKPLAKAHVGAEPVLQAQLLQILGQYNEPEALNVLRESLLSDDDAASARATEFLRVRLQEISESRRESFWKKLNTEVHDRPQELAPPALAHALEVLRSIDGQASRTVLLKYAGDKHPPAIRAAALASLKGVKLTQIQAGSLLEFLTNSESSPEIVSGTIAALGDHDTWSAKSITELKSMTSLRREEMKIFALRALRNTATEQTAKMFLGYLHHSNAAYREAAMLGLGNNDKALSTLLRSFGLEKDLQKAQTIAAPLRELAPNIKAAQLKAMCEKTSKLLGAGDPLGEVHLELCIAVNAELASEELIGKATRLRRARKLQEALGILLHLARGEHLDLEGRYQMALARLIMDHEEGRSGMTSHTGDATMGYIASLVRDGFPAFERLKKESMLEPEDLLRVGRHFNESIGPERRFGTDLLRFVADKHAKVKAGEEARIMIRSEGLA